jgi:flagellar assembly protein FliH
MSTIIKATDRNKAVQTVAFNFDDMAANANQYIQKIRGEAAKILAEAQKEAETLKKKAEAEGRRDGMAAIDKLAEQRLAKELSTLKPALLQAVEEIRHAKQAWLGHWEKSAIHTATAIAARLIRRELSQAPEITIALVREALELAAGNGQLKIRLNPNDHANLHGQVRSVVQELAPLAEAELIADPQITPGGCRLETRFGVVDQQFESQLARIEEELV